MTCGKCGKAISDDSIFCPYCGTKLPIGLTVHDKENNRLITRSTKEL